MTSILEGTQPPKTRPKFQSKHLSHEKKQPLLLSIESWLVYNRDPYLANTVIPPNQKKNLTNQTRGPFFHCSFSFQPVYLIPMGYGPPRYGKTGLVGAAMGAIAPFAFGRLRRGEDVGGRGGGDVFFPFFFFGPPKNPPCSQQKTQRLFGGEEMKIILGRDFVVFFFHGFYGLLFF